MLKYISTVFLVAAIFPCIMLLRGYIMYSRRGGKGRILEKVSFIESCQEYTKLENISPLVLFFTLALEDEDFFLHDGINFKNIKKAIGVNIKNKSIVMGGSTITQQLAKNLLFDFKKTFTRKIAEIFAVIVLEKTYSKEKILEVYLNCIEYGNDNWNIKSASGYYFEKLPIEIQLAQAVSLISILPSPKYYNPILKDDKFYYVRSSAIDLIKERKYLGSRELKIIKKSSFFEDDLFDSNLEKFYREIFRNSIRRAREGKTSLKVEIESALTEKILNGDLSSEGLILYAEDCCSNMKTSYAWGGMMDLIDEDMIRVLSNRYEDYYTEDKIIGYENLISEKVYGCDCSGLIKSYLFGGLNHPLYEEFYDINSSMMIYIAEFKGEIDSIPEIRGICLYMPGHVGIYAGNGQVIESTENKEFGNGVIKSNLVDRNWTDWFYCPFIKYKE